MSVFSIIRRGRRQAKENSQKQAERRRRGDAQPAYKHVPAHAAADALVGAPPTLRAEDKPRIMEENKRRSTMASGAANGTHGGMPRVSSGLSNVMYPAAHANPMVATQRSSGHPGPQQWQYHYHKVGTGAVYSVPDPPCIPEVPRLPSLKGKEIERDFTPGSTPGSSRAPSLLGDKGSGSVASSSNSIIFHDGLEMRGPERSALVARTTAPSSVATTPTETPAPDSHHALPSPATKTHRLHPSRQRRLSDASIEKPLSGSPMKKPSARPVREPGPPPSTRGFGVIPPVPTIPPLPRPADASHGLHNYSSMASSSSSLASIESSASSPQAASFHSQKTPNSSVSSTASSASYKAPQPTSVPPSAASEFVFHFSNESTSTLQTKPAPVGAGAATPTQEAAPCEPERSVTPEARPASPQPQARPYHTPNPQSPLTTTKPKSHYPPKVARFTEGVAEVTSQPQPQPQLQPRPARPTNWLTRRFSSSSRVSVVDEVPGPEPPEPGSIAEAAERASGKNRGSKTKPAKLLKKSRWSIGSGAR